MKNTTYLRLADYHRREYQRYFGRGNQFNAQTLRHWNRYLHFFALAKDHS